MNSVAALSITIATLALLGASCSNGAKDPGNGSPGGASSGSGGSSGGGGASSGSGSSGGAGTSSGSGSSGGGGTSSGSGGGSSGSSGGSGGGPGGDAGRDATTQDGAPQGGNGCSAGAAATAPNTLTVNVDSAQTVISPGIYGVLMERIGRDINGGLFVGTNSSIPNTAGMRNDIIQGFQEAGVGMIEWPGGCAANSYNWSPPNPANDMGTDDYMQLTTQLGIDPYIAGAATVAAATTNQQWVTYINNNSTHPAWNLKYFKVGNEVWGCGGNQTEATFETNYLANYNVLSTPVNGKPLSIVASTGLIGSWVNGDVARGWPAGWLDTEVKDLLGKIDGIEIHDYLYHPSDIPSTGFTDTQYYSIVNAANQGQIGLRLTQIIAILDKYDANKHIKIWEDEWGDWLEPVNKTNDGFFQQMSVMDAVSTAEQLHLFMQHADRIQMAGMAQAINVIHALFFTRASDAALVKTPAFYVFKMFLPHHTSNARWAPNTLVSENITGNGATFPVVSAGATVDDHGNVNISLANVDLVNTRTVQITLNSSKNGYTVSSAQVVTGPAKDSVNDFGQAETVNIQPLPSSSCTVSGKSLGVTLPSKSVVMLVLTPQ